MLPCIYVNFLCIVNVKIVSLSIMSIYILHMVIGIHKICSF